VQKILPKGFRQLNPSLRPKPAASPTTSCLPFTGYDACRLPFYGITSVFVTIIVVLSKFRSVCSLFDANYAARSAIEQWASTTDADGAASLPPGGISRGPLQIGGSR
jgi:hypothetical protein